MRYLLPLLLSLQSFAYDIAYDSVYIPMAHDTFFGIVVKPVDYSVEGGLTGILCIQGGGNVGLDNYLWEARRFAEAGYVALVCDKAGTGLSTGSSYYAYQSFEEKTQEYIRLIRFLKSYPGVNSTHVGIHGLSEGGRLSVNVAAKAPDEVAFSISVSGPMDSFMINQLYAIEQLLQIQGYSESINKRTVRVWDAYYSGVAEGVLDQTIIDSIQVLRDEHAQLYLPPASTTLPASPVQTDIHFNQINDFEKIECPMLFQFGREDRRVDAMRSVELIPDSPLFTIHIYDETGHGMVYQGSVHPNYMSDKLEWLEQHRF